MKRPVWLRLRVAGRCFGCGRTGRVSRSFPLRLRKRRPKPRRKVPATPRRIWRWPKPSEANGRAGAAPTATASRWKRACSDRGPRTARRSPGGRRVSAAAIASVAIAGGKIFTMGEQGGKTMAALPARWRTAVNFGHTEVGGGGGPNCTPTVDGDLVFGLTLGGDLACCKTADGELVWSKNYGRTSAAMMSRLGLQRVAARRWRPADLHARQRTSRCSPASTRKRAK